MQINEIEKALNAADMDTLREAGRSLEPIVGYEVRGRSKDGLAEEIVAALRDAEERAQWRPACNALAEIFGWPTIEPREEYEARESLASEANTAEENTDTAEADDEPARALEGASIIVVQCHPADRVGARRNDVVVAPRADLLTYPHAKISPARAVKICETYGRLNCEVSQMPEITIDDLRKG